MRMHTFSKCHSNNKNFYHFFSLRFYRGCVSSRLFVNVNVIAFVINGDINNYVKFYKQNVTILRTVENKALGSKRIHQLSIK